MIGKSFKDFVSTLQLQNRNDVERKFANITKRLNTSFWDDEENETDHSRIVGSIGRLTAINGVSDMDMLFILPDELFKTYDGQEGNGQKALLQDVKTEVKKRYPHESTKVRGDGQVVVVSFSNYEVEICPVFRESDGSYTYPDSNHSGKWKKTDPIPEIDASTDLISNTNSHFQYICQIMRAWKNHTGFKMGGLLIDTLVNNFFEKNTQYGAVDFDDYLTLLKDLFKEWKSLDKDRKYWYALGSNQHVYNKDSAFISKAERAYNKIINLNEESEDLYDILQDLFGTEFPVPEEVQKTNSFRFAQTDVADGEQFIEQMFPVDIKYRLEIDCEVSMNGFRETLLRKLLKNHGFLLPDKKLKFFILYNEVAERHLDYEIYWKVRNQGQEAMKRNQLRGEIVEGTTEQIEHTSFKGGHYVECYVIHIGTCVARSSIKVPINYKDYLAG